MKAKDSIIYIQKDYILIFTNVGKKINTVNSQTLTLPLVDAWKAGIDRAASSGVAGATRPALGADGGELVVRGIA